MPSISGFDLILLLLYVNKNRYAISIFKFQRYCYIFYEKFKSKYLIEDLDFKPIGHQTFSKILHDYIFYMRYEGFIENTDFRYAVIANPEKFNEIEKIVKQKFSDEDIEYAKEFLDLVL